MSLDQMTSELSYRLSVLDAVIPCPFLDLIDKGFQHLSSKEGYELLYYLLDACGVPLDINPTFIKHIGCVSLKYQHPSDKIIIEKHKGNILEAVKMLTQKINPNIKLLRKSDLMLPFNTKYLNCCLALTHFALNYLLEKFGFSLKIESPSDDTLQYFLHECETFMYQEMEMENENKLLLFHSEKYLDETMDLLTEIKKIKESKTEIETLIQEEIKRYPLEYSEQLKDPSTRNDAIASWSTYLDRKFLDNSNTIAKLEEMNIKLKRFSNFLNAGIDKNILDGNDLASLISDEYLKYAHLNQIDLLDENSFNVSGLIEMVLLSLKNRCLNIQGVSKLTGRDNSIDDTRLYKKLFNIEEHVAAELLELRSPLDTSVDPQILDSWLKEFFTEITELNISNELLPSQALLQDPLLDIENTEILLKTWSL